MNKFVLKFSAMLAFILTCMTSFGMNWGTTVVNNSNLTAYVKASAGNHYFDLGDFEKGTKILPNSSHKFHSSANDFWQGFTPNKVYDMGFDVTYEGSKTKQHYELAVLPNENIRQYPTTDFKQLRAGNDVRTIQIGTSETEAKVEIYKVKEVADIGGDIWITVYAKVTLSLPK